MTYQRNESLAVSSTSGGDSESCREAYLAGVEPLVRRRVDEFTFTHRSVRALPERLKVKISVLRALYLSFTAACTGIEARFCRRGRRALPPRLAAFAQDSA